MFKKIEEQINGTIGYIGKILHWTKNQMNGFNAELVPCNIYEMIEQCKLEFERPAQLKNITFRNDVNRWFVAEVDREMLDVVLRNLINNAIKFSYENSEVQFNNFSNEGKSGIAIEDFGVGIEPKRLEHLFDFNHKHTAGTQLERGSGIGLTLCKEFMERIAGDLTVKSIPNEGSTFFIHFKK